MGARALLLLRLLLPAMLPLGPAALLPDTCPGCTRPRPADSIRLEAIKLQILTKLGLKVKPHVKRTLPRELVLASLSRAGEDEGEPGNSIGAGSGHMGMSSGSGDPPDPDDEHATTDGYSDYDEFYGRTSEIITFAEQDYAVSRRG